MGKVTVCSPEEAAAPVESGTLAPRGALPSNPVLTLIENGKPNARRLLQIIAEKVRSRFDSGEINIFSKASAAKPIDLGEAQRLGTRSHLVITGIGD
ncbi:hypothetical protein ACFL9T_20310 [Thermodesulfobacteriota bacterium]